MKFGSSAVTNVWVSYPRAAIVVTSMIAAGTAVKMNFRLFVSRYTLATIRTRLAMSWLAAPNNGQSAFHRCRCSA